MPARSPGTWLGGNVSAPVAYPESIGVRTSAATGNKETGWSVNSTVDYCN